MTLPPMSDLYDDFLKDDTIHCGVHDFITNKTCVREKHHAPFHELADGTKFGIAVEDGE